MPVIETHKLTKYYGKSRGIIDLDLKVNEGEIFGFIGPNGAGKSTTIRVLLGLVAPTSGSAEVFGLNIEKNQRGILSKVGYMPSEAMFYSGMEVGEIISLSARLRGKDCASEAKLLCDLFEIDLKKKVEELSLGNRKKVGIVCAMQHKPQLYVLDEPTSGLDPLMQKEFFNLLQERNKAGAAIFLSSHVLSEIQRYCSRAAIIREGKLIVCDSVENLSKTQAKRVTLHGISKVPPELTGTADIHENIDGINFLYNGDIRALLHVLSKLPLTDMTVTEPDLEEIFMHYYTEGGEK